MHVLREILRPNFAIMSGVEETELCGYQKTDDVFLFLAQST